MHVHSVDGFPLPIAQLKGRAPVASLDLSGKELGVASAIIIGTCLTQNAALTRLNLSNNGLCGTYLERGGFVG